MRTFLCILSAAILFAGTAFAGIYKKCTYHYFKNGKKVATSECYDDQHRLGKATAYNRKGEVIYEKEIRTCWGHSTATFTYNAVGGVSSASWSSAPDGGIQWYSSKTTFAEDGKVTNYSELNYNTSPVTKIKQHKD